MSEKTVELDYDASARKATLTFPNGRTLAIRDINEDQAREFVEKHSSEFQKRDCCLTSVEGTFERGHADGE
jgi:hypothetical protein